MTYYFVLGILAFADYLPDGLNPCDKESIISKLNGSIVVLMVINFNDFKLGIYFLPVIIIVALAITQASVSRDLFTIKEGCIIEESSMMLLTIKFLLLMIVLIGGNYVS